MLRILCCVSGEEAGKDAVLMKKKSSAPVGILTKILYPSRPWPTALSPCYLLLLLLLLFTAIDFSLVDSSPYTGNK